MKSLLYLLINTALIVSFGSCKQKASETKNLGENLPRVETPVTLNDAANNMLARAQADSLDIHSIMIVKDGSVIYEKWQSQGKPETPHVLNSVSKTFTALGVGLAIADGKIKLDDKVISFFPDKLPAEVSDNLADMDIRDLLTMTCGHADDHTYEMQQLAKENPSMDWVKQFLSYPVEFTPGEVYCYNSVGTFMLSAIVQKVTGKKLLDYLDERIFAPLHIEDACWGETKEGQNFGGWGLYLKTEDLAKTGQLILQNGKWNGKQLVPAEWIAEMTKKQVPSAPAGINATELVAEKADPDWIQGYGYQMWMCRHQAFRADGARGQFILVLPEQNTVIAMTADTPRMQDELQLVWNYILPVLNTLK